MNYARVIKDDLGKHLSALKDLVAESTKLEPMRLFGLWRNAERRAAQGRYDDAVAQVYRPVGPRFIHVLDLSFPRNVAKVALSRQSLVS